MAGNFAHKVVHVTLQGTMLQGNEEWQTGFHMGYLTADAAAPTQAWVDAVRDAWVTFWRKTDTGISTEFFFTGVKAVLLELDGKYGPNTPVESFPVTAQSGNNFGALLPPQIALVATLIGGSGKGTGGKGRMYLPGVVHPVRANGHIDQSAAASTAANLAAFFDTIDAAAGAPGHVVNASKGKKVVVGNVTTYIDERNVPVNGVRVGNVYDTQRRRRNGLAETYSASVVAD